MTVGNAAEERISQGAPRHEPRRLSDPPSRSREAPGNATGTCLPRPGKLRSRTRGGRALVAWIGLSCLLALCQAAAAAAPASGHTLDRLMALLAQRKHREATFVEQDHLSVLTRPLKSSGVLIYEAPGHLEKRTLKPRPVDLVLDHGVLSMKRGGRTYHIDVNAYPRIAPYIEAVSNTLAGNRAALERLFNVDFQGNLAHWTLTLRPRDAHSSHLRRIRIEGARDQIRSVGILRTNGDHSRMTLGPPPVR